MSDAPEDWFPDAVAGTSGGGRFLARLRPLAMEWTELGLDAGLSTSVPVPRPFLGIELPHLSAPLRWLWILFLETPDGLAVDCEWGDDTRLNDWGHIDGNVYASKPDPDVTPEEMSETAANWIQAQAGRVVRRDDWNGRHPRSRWTFVDTEAILTESRPALWRKSVEPDATRIERLGT